MSPFDWIVLLSTLLFIVGYGVWKTRHQSNLDNYLLDSKSSKWWTIGLSVMATQASAITFLSTPGQAFDDGMRFVQFYFGLPIAMVIICITFIPRYSRLKVFTAYEFLEKRFDLKTRMLTACLFLLQRGLAAGITIFAPAIVLSSVLNVSLNAMILLIGGLVIIYTVSGGTGAVNVTQKWQMAVIFTGLFIAFGIILNSLPNDIGIVDAMSIAGATGKMNILDFSFNLNDKYTFWSGIIGGTFLQLSYFGTDQSQVQRYLTGASDTESRFGLLFNGVLKIPMQFFILLVGIMVFVFYQFEPAPIHFNQQSSERMYLSDNAKEYQDIEDELSMLHQKKAPVYRAFLENKSAVSASQIKEFTTQDKELRTKAKSLMSETYDDLETNDKDFVFIYFILNNLPKGLIGLLLAVFFSAAMSSTASELNALGATTLIDIYKRNIKIDASDQHYVNAAKAFTIMWGIIAILFALQASLFENLIQFVNIVGSLFYGTVLGIFLVAFYFKNVSAKSVFLAAIITQLLIFVIWKMDIVAYLWLNLIGCICVVIISNLFEGILGSAKRGVAK